MALLDPASHLQFLTDLLKRVDTSKSPEAHVLLLATLAHAKLLFGDHEGTKNDIDAAWKVLDELSGVEPSVNAAYYEVAEDYYKVRGEAPSRHPVRSCRNLLTTTVAGESGICPLLQEFVAVSCVCRPCKGLDA